jgi:hypothetical protein
VRPGELRRGRGTAIWKRAPLRLSPSLFTTTTLLLNWEIDDPALAVSPLWLSTSLAPPER